MASSVFATAERNIVGGVLRLAERNVRSIMTPRTDISSVDVEEDGEVTRQKLLIAPHGMFPVCRGSLDQVLGVARAKDLLGALQATGRLETNGNLREPVHVPETMLVIDVIGVLRGARGAARHRAPIDVLEAIAGEFPDEDEQLDILPLEDGRWKVAGAADLHLLESILDIDDLVRSSESYTLNGFLSHVFGHLPQRGDVYVHGRYEFKVEEVDAQRIRSAVVVRSADVPVET